MRNGQWVCITSEASKIVREGGTVEMDDLEMEFREAVASFAYGFEAASSASSSAKASFQWGGSIFVLWVLASPSPNFIAISPFFRELVGSFQDLL